MGERKIIFIFWNLKGERRVKDIIPITIIEIVLLDII